MSQTIDLKVEYTNKMAQENEALRAQVEQLRSPLRNLINVEHERGGSLQVDGQFAYRVKEQIFKDAENALDKTPAQCLAEIKARAVEDAANELASMISAPPGIYSGAVIKLNLIAKKLRQAAKGGE